MTTNTRIISCEEALTSDALAIWWISADQQACLCACNDSNDPVPTITAAQWMRELLDVGSDDNRSSIMAGTVEVVAE